MYFFTPAHRGGQLQLQTLCVCNVLFGAKSTKNAGVPIPPAPPQTSRDFRPWTHIRTPFCFGGAFHLPVFGQFYHIHSKRPGKCKQHDPGRFCFFNLFMDARLAQYTPVPHKLSCRRDE